MAKGDADHDEATDEQVGAITARMRARREELGLTQAEVGARLGINANTYHLWETGERVRSFPRVVAVCDVLDMSPNELLGYDPSEKLDALLKDKLDPELLGTALEAIGQLAVKKATPELPTGGDEAFWGAMGEAFIEVLAMTVRGADAKEAGAFLSGAGYFFRS